MFVRHCHCKRNGFFWCRGKYRPHGKVERMELLDASSANGIYTFVHGLLAAGRKGCTGRGRYVYRYFLCFSITLLAQFDKSFKKFWSPHLRGFFTDSYEVDDALAIATRRLIIEWILKRKGLTWRLNCCFVCKHIPTGPTRILCDYSYDSMKGSEKFPSVEKMGS